jgi:hypothetical protein
MLTNSTSRAIALVMLTVNQYTRSLLSTVLADLHSIAWYSQCQSVTLDVRTSMTVEVRAAGFFSLWRGSPVGFRLVVTAMSC